MQVIKQLDQFHNTRKGHLVFALIELALFYVFFSIAIDTASMLAYLLAIIFAGGTVHNLAKFIKSSKAEGGRRK